MRRKYRRFALLIVCIPGPLLTSCTRTDLESELDRARSWTATTRLAADRRSAGAINGAVASQLARRASAAVSEEETTIAKLTKTDPERLVARGVLDSLRQGIRQLEQAAP